MHVLALPTAGGCCCCWCCTPIPNTTSSSSRGGLPGCPFGCCAASGQRFRARRAKTCIVCCLLPCRWWLLLLPHHHHQHRWAAWLPGCLAARSAAALPRTPHQRPALCCLFPAGGGGCCCCSPTTTFNSSTGGAARAAAASAHAVLKPAAHALDLRAELLDGVVLSLLCGSNIGMEGSMSLHVCAAFAFVCVCSPHNSASILLRARRLSHGTRSSGAWRPPASSRSRSTPRCCTACTLGALGDRCTASLHWVLCNALLPCFGL